MKTNSCRSYRKNSINFFVACEADVEFLTKLSGFSKTIYFCFLLLILGKSPDAQEAYWHLTYYIPEIIQHCLTAVQSENELL